MLHPDLTRQQLDERIAKWTEGTEMTHKAVDDARYQAAMFHGLMRELKKKDRALLCQGFSK